MHNIKKVIIAVFIILISVISASCGSDGAKSTAQTSATDAPHVHSYSGEWQKDSVSHWQICECGEKSEEQKHTYKSRKCSVCGLEQASEGLDYKLVDGEYHVVGTGICRDTSIVIPSEYGGIPVTSIASNAFAGNTSIKNVRLGENIKDIGQAAFYDCSSLTGITFNDGLKNIGFGAFFKCISLKSIGVPESVEKIDGSAFLECSSLNSIKLPTGGCEIGADAFKETGYYNYVKNWENGVLYIGKYLIAAEKDGCPEKVTVKSGTKYISSYAFYNVRASEVILPESIVSIGAYAFSESGIEKIVLPKNLTRIEEKTFYLCYALKEIYIQSGVKFIGKQAFTNIHADNVITYNGSLDEWNKIAFEADALPFFTKINYNGGQIVLPEI